MTTGDLFWLALLFSAFYPLIKQKALELARQRLLSRPQAPSLRRRELLQTADVGCALRTGYGPVL
jgi:hypothetical protein